MPAIRRSETWLNDGDDKATVYITDKPCYVEIKRSSRGIDIKIKNESGRIVKHEFTSYAECYDADRKKTP